MRHNDDLEPPVAEPSPLHDLIEENDLDQIRSFLETPQARDLIDAQDSNGDTALHIAARKNLPQVISLLMRKQATVDILNAENITPLFIAVSAGFHVAAHALLVRGANTNVRRSDGKTPLHIAVENCDESMVYHLLINGARNNPDDNSRTPLHIACSNKCYRSCLEYLVGSFLNNVNTQNNQGKMALQLLIEPLQPDGKPGFSVKKDCKYAINRIIASNDMQTLGIIYKLNDQLKEELRFTPNDWIFFLIYACKEGRLKAVNFFIEQKVDVNGKVGKANSLCTSVRLGHGNIVRRLIESGADVNITGSAAESPLHLAVLFGRIDLARQVIDRGANTNALNADGRTPIFYARSIEMIRCLMTSGARINSAVLRHFKSTDHVTANPVEIVRLIKEIIIAMNVANGYLGLPLIDLNEELDEEYKSIYNDCLFEFLEFQGIRFHHSSSLFNIFYEDSKALEKYRYNADFHSFIDTAAFRWKYPHYSILVMAKWMRMYHGV